MFKDPRDEYNKYNTYSSTVEYREYNAENHESFPRFAVRPAVVGGPINWDQVTISNVRYYHG